MNDNEKLIEEAERGNKTIQAHDHRQLFEAEARERLISDAATAILASEGIEPQDDGTYWGENTWPNAVKDARVALAVFENAHTPTDDEREALGYAIRCAIPTDLDYRPLWKFIRAIQDSVRAAGFRRSEAPRD